MRVVKGLADAAARPLPARLLAKRAGNTTRTLSHVVAKNGKQHEMMPQASIERKKCR